MRASLITIFSLVVLIQAMTSPPAGALVVGQGGQYTTVQQAVDAAKSGQTIFINAGHYREQVFVPREKPRVTIVGQSSSDSSYKANTVSITGNRAQDNPSGSSNDQTGVLRAHGDHFKLYNVNLINTRGKGSQALALSAYGDKQGYYGCQFRGYQDTIMSEQGQHLFANSLIEGATDFIFGRKAQTWFENVDIKVIGQGFITANGRDSSSNPSYYVINRSSIDGNASLNGRTYLGRPWREYSRVVFQNSKLGAVINSTGWTQWSQQKPNTANVQYGEYGNTGPGSSGNRRLGRKLSTPVSVRMILPGYESWADSKYFHAD